MLTIKHRALRMGLILVPLCIIISVLFPACGIPTQQAAATSIQPTQVIHFYPTGIRATSPTPGYCWVNSLSTERSDAWRCAINNTIYDPCFSSSAHANYVICDANPAGDTRGIKVPLSQPLPPVTPAPHPQPWTLRLADNTVCTFLTGATYLIGNERVNYGCTNGSVIPGNPQTGKVWTAKVARQGQTKTVITQVKTVWF